MSIAAESLGTAEEACRQLIEKRLFDAEIVNVLGLLACQRGTLAQGMSLFRCALSGAPAVADAMFNFAVAALHAGNGRQGIDWLRRATATQADFSEAYLALAQACWPGEDYYGFLERLHLWLRPRRYLEIGVAKGRSLLLARPSTVAVGVDPAPELAGALPASTTVYRTTSDAFFASGQAEAAFAGQPIDMAFIDGLHRFEQALKDFANVERLAHPGAVILLHDCLPLDAVTAARTQTTRFYSGDVWRVVVCLKRFRPDLLIRTIAAPPTGLAMICRLNPSSTLLHRHFDEIVTECLAVSVAEALRQPKATLNLLENDWAAAEALLSSVPARTAA